MDLSQQWCFGLMERGTHNVIIIPVADRTANTLLPLIEEWVEGGSMIMSDRWAPYGGIQHLNGLYIHQAVNHRVKC